MQQNTTQGGAPGHDQLADRCEAARVARRHTGAVAVGIDLDQDGHGVAARAGVLGHRFGLLQAVEDHRKISTVRPDGGDPRELRRGNADRVDHVAHAALGEVLRLVQSRDCGRALGGCHRDAGDVERLRGLQVRAERDAEVRNVRAHPFDVGAQPRFIEEQARRLQGVQRRVRWRRWLGGEFGHEHRGSSLLWIPP